MVQEDYMVDVYKIEGESINPQLNLLFESIGVFLIIDVQTKIIWIWAGKKSRLFHRYIAASWAGKLKSQKKYYGFRYEIVKEDQEPGDFLDIFNKIKESKNDLEIYPADLRLSKQKQANYISTSNPQYNSNGITTNLVIKNQSQSYQTTSSIGSSSHLLLNSDKTQILKILSELEEMHSHINYSLKHIEQRISKIKKILNGLNVID
ncbi:MAG: hypothetical protein ACFFD2_08265 [Promethearchaeota archaeon]